MLASVYSCSIIGLDGVVLQVEVDTSGGLPRTIIVGLPDMAVQESRERVQSAVKNAGMFYPRKKVTVNLAPASVRKEGPVYDLPIAVGVLVATDQLAPECIEESMFIGELSLDGSVRHVRGILPMAALAREQGFKKLFVPASDAHEAALIPDISIYPVDSLSSLYSHLIGETQLEPVKKILPEDVPIVAITDFSEVKGQEYVKRALEVAAAGAHNLIMIGPPGAGKTLLARAIPGILPRMTIDESLDVTRIYSVADMLSADIPLIRTRPFRAPHHTISHAGLVGGGNWPHPGEITLAHRGVLFLDELPEFGTRVLEVLRQPVEDKVVTISRASGSLTFPANFMLVAAMNPCPCGYYGDNLKPCTCSPSAVTNYQKKISGPLLDRIDIFTHVARVDYQKLSTQRLAEDSATIQARVEKARQRQLERFKDTPLVSNSDMNPSQIRQYCVLDDACQALMKVAMKQLQLTARAYHRVLKLSRTIADLAGSEAIAQAHLAEALQYRSKMDLM